MPAEKNPGTRRRTAVRIEPCRTEPVLEIRAVDLTVAIGKWLCDYTNQGMAMAARQRALDRWVPRLTPTPAARSEPHSTNNTNEDIFSTQYAVLLMFTRRVEACVAPNGTDMEE